MKNMKKYGILFGLIIASSTILTHPFAVKAADNTEERISDGVHIGGMDVGGMTRAEAESVIADYVDGMMDASFTLSSNNGTISVTAEEMGVTADTDTSIDEALAIGKKGNLIQRFKEEKALEAGDYTVVLNLKVDRQKTANIIYENRESLDIPAEDNGLTRENGVFSYVEGQRGEEVNIVSSVYEIEKFLSTQWNGTDDTIALVVDEIEPRGTEEELAKIQDVLGTYSTNFSSSSYGRATNVKNGCAKIDGTVLYPGEEFSVYNMVSPFTQENGYELAGSYANGTTVETFGGGICQVSTTLYNAVIRAELEVTQRYNHSMIVTYVDPSEDAAIAGTYKDFCFVNNYDTPVYIEGYCDGGIITFNIYGEETRPSNREISFESEVLEKIDPETQFELSSSHDLGYFSTSQSSHTGYVAQLWKIVTVDGAEQSRDVFNKSTYKASPKIIVVGTKGATEEQLAAIKSAANSKDESKIRDAVSAAQAENKEAEAEEEEETETEEEAESGEDDEEGSDDENTSKKNSSGKNASKKKDADPDDNSTDDGSEEENTKNSTDSEEGSNDTSDSKSSDSGESTDGEAVTNDEE